MILIGRLTKDTESKTFASGNTMTTFTLAVDRRFANKETGKREADFLSIVVWRDLADLCAKYLSKGRKVAVVGSIQTRSYDAQDGTRRYVTEIVADEVEFLEKPSGTAKDAAQDTEGRRTAFETDDDSDDLPF